MKKILNIIIILSLFLAGILTPSILTKSINAEITVKKVTIDQTKIKSILCDLKIKEIDGEWQDQFIKTKVNKILEFKIKISSIDQYEKNIYLIFGSDTTSNPDESETILKFVDGSISDLENIIDNTGFFLIWSFKPDDFEKIFTFKAEAEKKGIFNPYVMVIPEELNSLSDIDFDIDELTVYSSKNKIFFNRIFSIFKDFNMLKILKQNPELNILINHDRKILFNQNLKISNLEEEPNLHIGYPILHTIYIDILKEWITLFNIPIAVWICHFLGAGASTDIDSNVDKVKFEYESESKSKSYTDETSFGTHYDTWECPPNVFSDLKTGVYRLRVKAYYNGEIVDTDSLYPIIYIKVPFKE
jgi:hypothetical protein